MAKVRPITLHLTNITVMNKFYFIIILLFTCINTHAQKFIDGGVIEYEVKTNVHRQFQDGDEQWYERIKNSIPKFTTNYYTLSFSNNKALYKFDRKGDTKQSGFSFFGRGEDESLWFNDYNSNNYTNLKVLDDYILLTGAHKNITWKLTPTDQRIIAGFNCRKAQTVLFDSVYVFVYYTDEIAVSGGPMGLHGLPGMILGVTVPRLYTSYVATSVKLNVDASIIKAPTKGKKKNEDDLKKGITDLAKSWGSDSKKWLDRMIWNFLL